MTLVASIAHRPKTVHSRPRHTPRPGPEPVPCPHCGHAAGFILDVDDFAYRVLEDDRDTDLLEGQHEHTPLTCAHCDTAITLVDALALTHRDPQAPPSPRRPEAPRHPAHPVHRRRRSHDRHPHDAGAARWRTTRDGRRLPACPQCPREHGFLADLGGVAYHVLEDDQDTDLLGEADNLLCPDCGAVFMHQETA